MSIINWELHQKTLPKTKIATTFISFNALHEAKKVEAIEEFAKHLPLGGISFWGDSNQNLLIRVWFHRDCARVDLERLSQLRAVFPYRAGDADLIKTTNNPVLVRNSDLIDVASLLQNVKHSVLKLFTLL